MFEIKYSHKAEKFIKKSEEKLKQRLEELFLWLQEAPIPAKEYDLRKIGGKQDTYRIRLSSHRVTYSIFWEEKIIRVLFIERRHESTYKQL